MIKRTVHLSKQLTAGAGENYVAFQVFNHGARAEHTTAGRQGLDLIASNIDDTRHVGIQVKTKTGSGLASQQALRTA